VATQVAPTPQIKKHHITLDEYERMIEADVFRDQLRLELIRGELIEMSPPGIEHEFAVARLSKLLERTAGDKALVWPQGNSIRLPNSDSRPQPDLTLLRLRDDYSSARPPVAEDVLLVVEVSDTSLRYDKSEKLALYAEAGISTYWIVNVQSKSIEIYTDPAGGTYTKQQVIRDGLVPLPKGIAGEIAVEDILSSAKSPRK
jgi:Uma2 family endonuclease